MEPVESVLELAESDAEERVTLIAIAPRSELGEGGGWSVLLDGVSLDVRIDRPRSARAAADCVSSCSGRGVVRRDE